MRIQSLIFVLFLLLASSVYSAYPKDDKKKVEPEDGVLVEPQMPEGIVYALPRTGLMIHVGVQKTSYTPGPYSMYSQKYMGYANVRTSKEVKWMITSLEVESFSEADPNALFKAMDIVASQLAQLNSGVIAGVGISGLVSDDLVRGTAFINPDIVPLVDFPDLSSNDYYNIEVNPETGAETMVLKSQEEKAREVADYIMRLRKKRSYTILDPSDAVPEDGTAYAVFVQEAQRIEKEYLSLFVGKESISQHQFSFSFVPGNDNVKNEVLFRFSNDKGVLPVSDLSGQPVLITLLKNIKAFKEADRLKEPENDEAGVNGLYYRIPVSSSIEINFGMNMIYSGRTVIAQFGVLAPVPDDLIDGNHIIEYNTETGSIKAISGKK
jgi:hypothetical protein